MKEQVFITDLRTITLTDNWIVATDLMGQEYYIDPEVALAFSAWVAKQYQTVRSAQLRLMIARRREEAALYGPLLDIPKPQSEMQPPDAPLPTPASSPAPKRRRTSRRKSDR